MPITRKFLGFERPALQAAADLLIDQSQRGQLADLSGSIVVLPGRRAGRRLLEILVQRCEQRQLVLLPPLIETVGLLPEQLYPPQRPFASEFVQKMAWANTLHTAAPGDLRPVIPHPPADQAWAEWIALADLLLRQHNELASDGLDFGNVVDQTRGLSDFAETARWQALAQLQRQYLERLDALDLWDVQTARLVAIQQRECRTDRDIFLVATADMSRAQRQMLDQVSQHVTALVAAPAAWSDRFDGHGCLIPERWSDVEIVFDDEQIHPSNRPVHQAEQVARCLARYDGKYRPDEVTIGVADERLVPLLERHLSEHVATRWGPGAPLGRSAPFRLLEAVAAVCERADATRMATLLRHPDVGRWLVAAGLGQGWMIELDNYCARRLPLALNVEQLQENSRTQRLLPVLERVTEWLRPLQVEPRSIRTWSPAIMAVLAEVYADRTLRRSVAADRGALAACQAIAQALAELQRAPPGLSPQLSATGALRLVLESIEAMHVPAATDPDAIEMLGWLELPLDDAPALIVTTFNEGYVPSSVTSDLFLPNSLRSHLGLLDNERRYARDVYATSVLLATREQVDFVFGRRNLEDEPLTPSRLLFATDHQTIARRAADYFDSQRTEQDLPSERCRTAAREQPDFPIPRPQPLPSPVQQLSVTEFRSYLTCPYRFYLQKIKQLHSRVDLQPELDPASFGSLMHAVLLRFGNSPSKDSTDEQEVGDVLMRCLSQSVWSMYGEHLQPVVRIQIEQLRLRLMAFARVQARRAASGWRIVYVESEEEKCEYELEVDGQAITVTGRIDRIDQHPQQGFAILDYKTSDAGRGPRQTHQKGSTWIDLQLPLYRHLAASITGSDQPQLGYLLLPKDTTKTGVALGEWTAEELAAADAAAQNVVRDIRAERFWPPADLQSAYDDFGWLCQEGVFDQTLANRP